MKIFRSLLIIIIIFTVFGCTQEKTEPEIQNHIEEPKQEENTDSQIIEDSFDEYSVLITAKAINIRNIPDATNKENISGQVYMGETYTVLEQTKDDKYTWYRIGENKWIANDGTWCVEFDKGENKDYPYVMNEEEANEFLSVVDTGLASLSCHSDNPEFRTFYLNIFKDSYAGANIHFSVDTYYKYDINYVVRVNEKTYDLYIVPVDNNGISDNSTGALRIFNIGKEVVGDGNGGERECFCFDMTLIQNNKNTRNDYFNGLYNGQLHCVVYGQVSF